MICKPSRLAPVLLWEKSASTIPTALPRFNLRAEGQRRCSIWFSHPKDQLAAAPQKVERKVVEIKPSEASTVRKKTEEKTVRRRKPSIDYEAHSTRKGI